MKTMEGKMRKWMAMAAMFASAAAMAEGGGEGLVKEESFKAWRLTIGPVMSPRVRVRISGPRPDSFVRAFPSSAKSGKTGNVAADPSAGHVAREYEDGYVRPDKGTADPDTLVSDVTWDWGAKDVPGQYSNGKMEFRTESSSWSETTSSTSYSSGSRHDSDRDILLGVEAMGGWTFYDAPAWDAAVDAGFRFYGSGNLKTRSGYGTVSTTTRSEYRYVDSYDASGWSSVPTGSHTGTSTGPGRLIGATPERREELAGTASSSQMRYYRTHTKLNYRIWDLRLGPSVGWKATDSLTIRGGVYGLLGLVDAKLQTHSDSLAGGGGAKKSTCEPVFGMAAGLSAQFNLTENLFLVGGAEYDWWTDAVSLETQGARAKIKLSDFTVSLAMGLEF